MSDRFSKSGVRRGGKRGGNIARLNETSRAYAPVVAQAMRQYDGHNGTHAIVLQGNGKVTMPMLARNDENAIADLLSPKLPNFGHNFSK